MQQTTPSLIISYPHKPIATIEALAKCLNVDTSYMQDLLSALKSGAPLYKDGTTAKKDGTLRQIVKPHKSLKKIQRSIVDKILKKCFFPAYLHGGIACPQVKRSIYSNASTHIRNSAFILIDIQEFYPTIDINQVISLFKKLFKFHPLVAEILAILTTRNGRLPQGTPTSSYIANMIFWEKEPKLVETLLSNGFCYTRYADDITISAKDDFTDENKNYLVSKTFQFLNSYGFKVKRQKLHIRKKGQILYQNGSTQPLSITGIIPTANEMLTIGKSEKKNIRAAIHTLNTLTNQPKEIRTNVKNMNSISGKIGRFSGCKHPIAKKLKMKIREKRNESNEVQIIQSENKIS